MPTKAVWALASRELQPRSRPSPFVGAPRGTLPSKPAPLTAGAPQLSCF